MDKWGKGLEQSKLFSGIQAQEREKLLHCLCARQVDYKKGSAIIEQGSRVSHFGILLSGHGRAVKWDVSDRLVIISLLKKGSEIGVIVAASAERVSPVTVQAQDDVCVLQIPFERVISRCEKACPRHDRLLRNYIQIVAEKGIILHERIDCLLRPTVREKILAYLWRMSREQQKRTFTIPMDRGAMAEYLNIERSALSRELSSMKREGIIDYYKNAFKLI